MPNKTIHFLTLDEVLAIYSRLIEKFGGASGVRDLGLLESALFRPKTGYYDSFPDLAAALFESLINNHPFFDGNKRVAFFATDVFLRINGFRLDVEPQPAYRYLMNLFETGCCDFDHLKSWIEENIRTLD